VNAKHMKLSCTKTTRVSAPCSKCGAWPPVVHIPSSHLDVLCESCCPACSAKPAIENLPDVREVVA
jgi:hypothetical protein